MFCVILAGLTLGALGHVAVQAQKNEVAVQLGREQATYETLITQRRHKQIEIGRLKNPGRLVDLARGRLGMTPEPAGIRVVRRGRPASRRSPAAPAARRGRPPCGARPAPPACRLPPRRRPRPTAPPRPAPRRQPQPQPAFRHARPSSRPDPAPPSPRPPPPLPAGRRPCAAPSNASPVCPATSRCRPRTWTWRTARRPPPPTSPRRPGGGAHPPRDRRPRRARPPAHGRRARAARPPAPTDTTTPPARSPSRGIPLQMQGAAP